MTARTGEDEAGREHMAGAPPRGRRRPSAAAVTTLLVLVALTLSLAFSFFLSLFALMCGLETFGTSCAAAFTGTLGPAVVSTVGGVVFLRRRSRATRDAQVVAPGLAVLALTAMAWAATFLLL